MKPLAHVLFALALAGVQAALLRWVGGGSFSLMLPAACVVFVALHGGNVDGSISAAGIGYVMDLMGGSPKGLMTFLAVALFLAVRATSAAVDVTRLEEVLVVTSWERSGDLLPAALAPEPLK